MIGIDADYLASDRFRLQQIENGGCARMSVVSLDKEVQA
jgi:hypothetical protein